MRAVARAWGSPAFPWPSSRAKHCQVQQSAGGTSQSTCCSLLCCEISGRWAHGSFKSQAGIFLLLWMRTEDSVIFKSCDVSKAEKLCSHFTSDQVWEFFIRNQVMQIKYSYWFSLSFEETGKLWAASWKHRSSSLSAPLSLSITCARPWRVTAPGHHWQKRLLNECS